MILPTSRGVGVASSTIILLLLHCLKPDPAILSAATLLSALILLDLTASQLRWRGKCRCSVNAGGRVWVWEKPKLMLSVEGYGVFRLENPPSWLKIISQRGFNGKLSVEATATFPYSGRFTIRSLNVLRISMLKLFLRREDVPCSVEFQVLPEALYWLLEALAILRGGYGAEYLSVEVKAPALSGLYYETRDYVPGDSLRSIDWKASSRRRRLMIKVFEDESGGGISILYDLRGPTPHVCDQLASALLSSTIASYRRRLKTQFINIQDWGVFKPLSPHEAIVFAVRNVLESRVLRVREFFEYVEPPTRREIEEIISKLPITQTYRIPYRVIQLENRSIAISSLLYDASKLVETASILKNHGGSLNVIVPLKPWRAVGDLEEAYRIYLTYRNVKSKLEKLNAKIIQWTSEIAYINDSGALKSAWRMV